MNLKPDELAMLNGEEGELRQEAMKALVRLGTAFGAKEMVDIKFAFAYTFVLLQDLDPKSLPRVLSRELIDQAIKDGVRVKVPTVGALDSVDQDCWEEMQVPEDVFEQAKRDYAIERALGINPVGSCTPYNLVDMNVPPLGTHMITVESSAIPYYNSVLGARCERCGTSALFAALTGKYPAMGYHLDENRFATVRIDVKVPLKTITDFGCLGQFAGEFAGMDVPVFTGITEATTPGLVAMCCAISTGGPVSLFHIPGITAEFRTLEEALNCKQPERVVEFGEKELRSVYERFPGHEGDKVDTVMIGCPHLTIFQLEKIALALQGKKKPEDLLFIMNTAPATKAMADKMGYVKMVKDAGAMLIAGSCPIIGAGIPGPVYTYTHLEYSTGVFVTDSLKAAAYAKSTMGARRVILGSTDDCLKAAVTGVWREKE